MALKSRPPTDLSASSVEVNLNDRQDGLYLQSTVAYGQRAGRDAWKWYNDIGEVHYSISRSARVAGYCEFMAVEFGPDGKVVKTIDTGQPAELAQSFFSAYGGVRGLVERYYTLLKVPGDMYLIRMKDDTFHLASPDELDVQSFAWYSRQRGDLKEVRLVTVPGGYGALSGDDEKPAFSTALNPNQLVGRVWSPSKRYIDVPESALHALDTECSALRDLTLSIKAQLRSRFALAGLLVLPPNMSMATSVKGKGRISGQVPEATVDLIVAAMTRNVRNLDEAQALLPIILRAAHPDDGEKIKHIILDRKIFETDLELRRELIGRILQSLDSNQDSVKGTSEQSHWGGWMAADEERRVAIAPDLEGLCWSASRLIMQRGLTDGKYAEKKGNIGFWYDLSRAAAKSNMQEDARQGWDRILISDPAARRMSGIPESDAPSDVERVRAAGRLVKNPMLMLYGTPEYDKIDWDKVGEWAKSTGPAPDTPADDPEAGPGEGDPGSPDDRETDTPRTERPA